VYYVSQALLQHRADQAGSLPRIAAKAIEGLVAHKLKSLANRTTSPADHDTSPREALRRGIRKVEVAKERVVIAFAADLFGVPGPAAALKQCKDISVHLRDGEQVETTQDAIIWSGDVRLKLRGGAKRIEGWEDGAWTTHKARPNKALIAVLVEAHRYLDIILTTDITSVEDLVRQVDTDRKQARLMLRLALLAPDIQRAIMTGSQAPQVTIKSLYADRLPTSWTDQRRMLSRTYGFARADDASI
jgi:hypothetical protein